MTDKIYESPDGGLTVYERDTKTGERICIERENKPDWHLEDHEFHDCMIYATEGNKTLQKLMSKMKMTYNLLKED